MQRQTLRNTLLGTTVALLTLASVATAEVKVDPALPAYQKTSGVAGNLNSVGSDTLNNLMTYWAENFRKMYPMSIFRSRGRAPPPRRRH